jgi:hypothetical protein
MSISRVSPLRLIHDCGMTNFGAITSIRHVQYFWGHGGKPGVGGETYNHAILSVIQLIGHLFVTDYLVCMITLVTDFLSKSANSPSEQPV